MVIKICLNEDLEFDNKCKNENFYVSDSCIDINICEEQIDIVLYFDSATFELNKLSYAFYGREFLLSDSPCSYKCKYGFMYPFSMITFLYKDKGVTYIVDKAVIDEIELVKNEHECYFKYSLANKIDSKIELKKYIHSNRYTDGIDKYQRWYCEKYGGLPESEKKLQNVYHVKRYYFHDNFCDSHILGKNEILLNKIYKDDCQYLGGIDLGLLFDFAYNPQNNIRCGNVDAISFDKQLLKLLNEQITMLNNCLFFGYFDPYLIQENSELDQEYRSRLPILKENGEMRHIWDYKQWAPCVGDEIWKNYSVKYLQSLVNELALDGIYLDEFGNGTQYHCYDKKHSHGADFSQFEAEYNFISTMKNSISEKYWMCEFPPSDCRANHFNIVLSDTRTLINIYRFVFPKLKFVRIIGCDYPLGDNAWDLNLSFFNGEALWIDNDIHDKKWYPDHIKKIIKEQYFILKKYSDFFTSEEVEALFYRSEDGIVINYFAYGNEVVLTYLNTSENDISKELNFDNLIFVKNLYSGAEMSHIESGKILMKIKKQSVGCGLFQKITPLQAL
ncbi:MAG: hypothetical protein IKW30_09240 [Lachnospiraceae bacterium]|nr:hypothetical protein [Lachnospiraceae bacterium]